MPKRAARVRKPQVDLERERKLHLCLRESLRAAIATGEFPPGARLPSTRTLAASLGVSRNTAARAYEDLWAEGLLSGRVGAGTYVAREAAWLPGLRERLRTGGFPLDRLEFRDLDGNPLSLIA